MNSLKTMAGVIALAQAAEPKVELKTYSETQSLTWTHDSKETATMTWKQQIVGDESFLQGKVDVKSELVASSDKVIFSTSFARGDENPPTYSYLRY